MPPGSDNGGDSLETNLSGANRESATTMRMVSLTRLVPRAAIVGSAAAALGLFFAVAGVESALSQSSDCERLRQAIADSSHSAQNSQVQAAAERQRSELERTSAYAHSIGCENHKILIFGSDPPAQCVQINAQIERMRANLSDLQSRAGGQGGRGDLVARYNAQCLNQPAHQPNFFEALFGGGQPKQPEVSSEPITPEPGQVPDEKQVGVGEARAGSKAVCVRACDGSFFPVSYSASGGRLDDLEDMCHALCPNADVALYTYPGSGVIEQAVSISGARYMDTPTALKYRQTFDPTCSCRRRGQTWAEALAGAEAKLGRQGKTDILVTPEKAVELSRPVLDSKGSKSDAKAKLSKASMKPAPGTDANGVDTTLSEAAASISRDSSGILGAGAQTNAPVSQDQGQSVEVTGPDGVKRRVRIVGPTL